MLLIGSNPQPTKATGLSNNPEVRPRRRLCLLLAAIALSGCFSETAPPPVSPDAGSADAGMGDAGHPSPDDWDGDGLSNEEEQTGRRVVVDALGFGLHAEAEFLEQRWIRTDPLNADTDGDGIDDRQESLDVTDATRADSDGDGLSDYEEKHRFGTNPLTVDSDGDARDDASEQGLPKARWFDGAELEQGTSPSLADTDGDGMRDSAEPQPGRSPMLAEIPQANIEIPDGSEIEIALNVTYDTEESTSRTYGGKYTTSQTNTQSRSDTESTAVTIAASSGGAGFFDDLELSKKGALKFFGGKLLEFGRSSACDARTGGSGFDLLEAVGKGLDWASQGEACAEATPETVNTTSTTLTRSSSQTESSEYSDYATDSQRWTESTSSGTIAIGVDLRNTGISPFVLVNPTLTVMQWEGSDEVGAVTGAGRFRTVATLAAEEEAGVEDDAGNQTFTLAPQERIHVRMVNEDVNVDSIKRLLANPTALFFAPADFQVSDQEGADYDFLTSETIRRTATVVIDDGRNPVRRYMVATNVQRDSEGELAGIGLADAFRDIIGIQYETVATTREVEGRSLTVRALERLGSLANHRSEELGQPEAGIPGDPQGFWILYTSRPELSSPALGFEDIVLEAGDELRFIYMRDQDGDGLFEREEALYGTDDLDTDTDADGLTDFEELKVGWNVDVAGQEPYRTLPNPLLADADGDGLDDLEERTAGTDPSTANTDEDIFPDNCDPAPLDPDTTGQIACRAKVPAHVYALTSEGLHHIASSAEGDLSAARLVASDIATPRAMDLHGDNGWLYLAGGAHAQVMSYSIDRDSGELVAHQPILETQGEDTTAIAVDPRGGSVFTTVSRDEHEQGRLRRYALDVNRGFPRADTEAETLEEPDGLHIAGSHIYIWQAGDNSIAYDAVGALFSGSGVQTFSDRYLFDIGSSSDNAFVYTTFRRASGDHGLAVHYSDEGELQELGSLDLAAGPNLIASHPTEHWVYVANRGARSANVIGVDHDSGEPTLLETKALGFQPTAIVGGPMGNLLYIAGADGTVRSWTIDPQTGGVVPRSTVQIQHGVLDLVVMRASSATHP